MNQQLYLKSCPRCGGAVEREDDPKYGIFLTCMMCGQDVEPVQLEPLE